MMKPLLMGAETEYSMSGRLGNQKLSPEQVYDLLLPAIRRRHKWLRDLRSPLGLYLENGSRYYLDTGAHNEFCTPELTSPRQVACYDRVNERILLAARKDVMANHSSLEICITKNNINVGMPDEVAWGQHEAFTCWVPLQDAARQLIPHLVSRLPYASAGCLSANGSGMGFELSQRARHMTCATSLETTHNRAIFCMRAWKPSDVSTTGWTRTNLISKDSQRCSFGMYLSFGVTGLLFALINQGHQISYGVELQTPVKAMRQISLDPWLKTKVKMADGRHLTAIEIQRLYRDKAEKLIRTSEVPAWSAEVLDHWSTTLDQLEQDPFGLADRLDTYLKLAIIDHELSRAGYDWQQLRQALQILDDWRHHAPETTIRAILTEDSDRLDAREQMWFQTLPTSPRVKQLGLEALRFAVRLQALELHYHELGGLFDSLAAAGHVDPVVVTPEEVERAIHHAPPGGRADARGRRIRELSGTRVWRCEWQAIVNTSDSTWFDMRDPFSDKAELSKSALDGLDLF